MMDKNLIKVTKKNNTLDYRLVLSLVKNTLNYFVETI